MQENEAEFGELEEDTPGKRKPKQDRIDGMTRERALDEFKEASARHAELSERWKTARNTLEVREDDLRKAFGFGDSIDGEYGDAERLKVAKSTAKAVATEKRALEARQEAASAVKVAWELVQSFDTHEPPRPLIPDPEPPAKPESIEQDDSGNVKKSKRKKAKKE